MLKRFFISLLLMWPTILMAQKQNVWIDADTGNEVDDIYAIIRLLNEPRVKVVGLSSAHFNNPDLLTFDKWNQYDTKGISTIQISQKLNEEILTKMKHDQVMHPQGADRQIGRAWGGFEPRPSEATIQLAQFIKNMPKEEKLDIICLGALTNIASAVMTHPEIISRIRCYILAAQYDATTGTWNKNEFNVRNDLNAFDYLMGLDSISLYVLPTTIAQSYRFKKDDTFKRLSRPIPAHQLPKERWEETEATSEERTLWDLALAEAYLNPHWTNIESRTVPPENGQKKIQVFINLDSKKLFDDFWNYMDQQR